MPIIPSDHHAVADHRPQGGATPLGGGRSISARSRTTVASTSIACWVRLAELLPADTKVCVVADRGFGDQNLYRLLTEELHFEYVIRFRGNISVTATSGETRTAAAWVRAGGGARMLRGAAVTADRYPVGTVVCVQDPAMKQAWCLAASSTDATAKASDCRYYGRRWGIECGLREYKGPALRHGDGRDAGQIFGAA